MLSMVIVVNQRMYLTHLENITFQTILCPSEPPYNVVSCYSSKQGAESIICSVSFCLLQYRLPYYSVLIISLFLVRFLLFTPEQVRRLAHSEQTDL